MSRVALPLFLFLPLTLAARAIDFQSEIAPIFAEHCLECHGPDDVKGGLNLTTREGARKELKTGSIAVVPGKPGESELVARMLTADEDDVMPPRKKEKRPSPEEIARLQKWIAEGAPWGEHWAYLPVRRPEPPPVKATAWARNEIDAFILAPLEGRGIAPSPEADRATLIKRVYYDLLGLPPTPEEMDAFIADGSPGAYEKVVEHALASPHFGERWGRHWLDKARYADSDGYEKDSPRPDAWRYRDWVIESFNRDQPFDAFTIEQLAGDLLPEATPEQRLATAFHRQTLTNREGGVDQEQYRVEAVFDRAETTGSVWLGLTVGCARCHTHKYDQISQREYYQLFAFFNNADEATAKVGTSAEALAKYEKENARHLAELKTLQERVTATRAALAERLPQWEREMQARAAAPGEAENAVPERIRRLARIGSEKWTAPDREELIDFLAKSDEPARAAAEALARAEAGGPKAPLMDARVIAQRVKNPRETKVLHRGEFLQPGERVEPGTLAILPPLKPRPGAGPDRLDLARWLVSRENPLTARVVVNDVWMRLFGEGLVRTPGDFGVRGERPTHPELLDWLADEFVARGWSRKALVRAIVTSAAYRQSSAARRDLREIDPQNRLLARQNRMRVEGEIARDLHLAASGLLARKIGGPSVYPPLPPEVAAISYANNFKWKESKGEDRYRRGLYTFFKRTAPYPDLMVFDCPDANVSATRRSISNTPLQALTTLNAETFTEAARALAERALTAPGDDRARLTAAFRWCLGRAPSSTERDQLLALLDKAHSVFAHDAESVAKLVSGGGANPSAEAPAASTELAAWIATTRIILNTDEFITRE